MKRKRGRPRKIDKVEAELQAMIKRLKSPENRKQNNYLFEPLSLWQRIKNWFKR
jgi:hypothetical protein